MRLVSALLVGSLWAPAAAAATPAEIYGGVDTVEISEEVEVSLLSLRSQPLLPVVRAQVNDGAEHEGALFTLSSGRAAVQVTEAFAGAHELEIKTNKRTGAKSVAIDRLAIGGLVLRGVTAVIVEGPTGSGAAPAMTLGLGALDGVAYAIQPSAGVVRFVPAASGAGLLESVGGTPVAFKTTPPSEGKVGKDKQWLPGATLLVPARFGGAEVTASLDTAVLDTQVRQAVGRAELDAAIGGRTHQRGDVYRHRVEVAVAAGEARDGWVSSTTVRDLSSAGVSPISRVGMDWLWRVDLAVDPATATLALRPITEPTRTDTLPGQLRDAAAAAEAADTAAAEAAKESGEEAGPDAGAWRALAGLHAEAGQYDDALAAWDTALGADELSCAAHLGRAEALIALGQLDGAVAAADRAAALYHSWWDDSVVIPGSAPGAAGHPEAVPAQLRPRYAQVPLKNRKGEWIPTLARAWWTEWAGDGNDLPEGLAAQDAGCWTADTLRAQIALATGDGGKAVEIYEQWVERFPPMQLVLDPSLAMLGANAQLVAGDMQGPQAQLRQAARVDLHKADQRWALGLALTYVSQERWDSAEPLFLQALHEAPADTVLMQHYLDAAQKFGGTKAMSKAAREFSKVRPDALVSAFGRAYAAAVADKKLGRDDLSASFADTLTETLARNPFDAWVLGNVARTHLVLGDNKAAAGLAKEGAALDPADPAVLLVQSELSRARGGEERATALAQRAAVMHATHPGYQLLPAPVGAAPAPEPEPEPSPEGAEAPPASEGAEAPPSPAGD